MKLRELEDGGVFSQVGIGNFLDADYFSWYLDVWSSGIDDAASAVIQILTDYEPATVVLKPENLRDLFKRLYQDLIPREIRRKLGEYFTPDWLAEMLLDEVEYDGEDSDGNLLDPSCGSGTFLVIAIRRAKESEPEIRDYPTKKSF